METDALIAAFRHLRTNDSRLEAIKALVDELSPHEYRALRDITRARTFQFDIIGQLPVEIVARVFAHLEPSTPYRLQRVSRQWCYILQSPDVLKQSLALWYGNTLDLQGADRNLLESKARHVHAFRHGEPSCHFRIDLNDSYGYATFVNDTLVWSKVSRLDPAARAIYLFNIKKWTLHTLIGDAREKVHRLFASDSIVGFATTGTVCYVWSLEGSQKRRFRVSTSALFQSITCRGDTVACAGCLDHHVMVYVWDYQTQRGRSFTISYDSPIFPYPTTGCDHRHGLTLLPQPYDEHVIVFVDDTCGLHHHHNDRRRSDSVISNAIRYGRYKYTGECVGESQVILDIAPATITILGHQLKPVDHKCTFRLHMEPSVCLQFSEDLFKFTDPPSACQQDEILANNSMYWWKDVLFELRMPEAAVGVEGDPGVVHLGTSDQSRVKPLTAQRAACRSVLVNHGVPMIGSQERVYLNDRHVVYPSAYGFEVLCFGERPRQMDQSGSFFEIGSFEIIDGAQ